MAWVRSGNGNRRWAKSRLEAAAPIQDSPKNEGTPMTRFQCAILAAGLFLGFGNAALAADDDAKAVVDKAVKAIGGSVDAAKAYTWKTKGTLTLNESENKFTTKVTAQGINHYRQEFEGEFDGNPIKGVTVLDGDKAWRKIGDDANKLEDDQLANEKRTAYLLIIGQSPSFLKGEGFKVESDEEEKVDGKPATELKVTGPDGKDFEISFDKATGLPVKMTATVVDFQGEEYKQETLFKNYKEFDGIKRASKIETKRNGKKFVDYEIVEFKVLDKADKDAFAEPK
jgi:hypothetical protein